MHEYIGDHIKAILFDHDDTLVGSIEPKWAEHKYVAQHYYGKTLTDVDIVKHWGKPLNELVRSLYDTENTDQAISYHIAHHAEYPKQLFPGTIEMLQYIHERGKLIGVITATNRFNFEHDLDSAGVPREIIGFTQTAEDTPYHKPDHRVFEPVTKWLAGQDVQSNEVIYVGDGLHDMKAALGAGFSFLGVETGLVSAGQFKEANAISISSVGEILRR